MQRQKIQVEVRTSAGSRSARRMVRAGILPGVVYGPGTEPLPISVNLRELRTAMQGKPANAVLLEFDGVDQLKGKMAILREVQRDPVTDQPIHVDIMALEKGHKLQLTVPVHVSGRAIGLQKGGIFEQQLHSVNVEVLPKDIPEAIVVDISALDVGQSLHVREIALPEGVKVLGDENLPVATVIPPKGAATTEGEEA